ncbi:bacterial regulatory, arsR family protein [Pseudarthrobacter siccitolerans]|uniref:Bacterial regulatory, arsR family protein n=1 Tax=Pseudarthrobacter siccitolerans TaxID=861266 RepID=A0A024GZK5_9MICC|nr:metalloregulator ArsR/SmtB family transcription factor [Pseudarthrobacter siccitolerans]CCQ45032.1 bacterial regulatory, arsR family protein [Pseudarthrobacter siccitolerans]
MSSQNTEVKGYGTLTDQPVLDGHVGPSMYSAAELFKAVAHPVRAQILELLIRGECTIPELCDGTGLKPSHLSRHLAQMRGQHLIKCVRSGGRLVYKLGFPEAGELLAAARSVLHARTAAAVSSLPPMPEEEPFTPLWRERYSAPEAALVSRSVIADACQAIAARTGCSPEAAAGRLIMTARTCKITLLDAALEELRGEEASSDA